MNNKELLDEIYDAFLYTVGAVAISMITCKAFKESLRAPETLKGVAKLGSAIADGVLATK